MQIKKLLFHVSAWDHLISCSSEMQLSVVYSGKVKQNKHSKVSA